MYIDQVVLLPDQTTNNIYKSFINRVVKNACRINFRQAFFFNKKSEEWRVRSGE